MNENAMTRPKPSVLAIDDEQAMLLILSTALADDFVIHQAVSGREGLVRAREIHPDLILLDVIMPDMSGYEVCRLLKADPSTAGIPVVFVTILDGITHQTNGLRLGALDYLTKPINVSIARQRIKNLIQFDRLRKAAETQRDHLEMMVQSRTEALSIAKEAAEVASRAKSIFLGNMSHEFRTPMNAILGITGLVKNKLRDPTLRNQLQKVETASRELLAFLNEVIDITQLEAEQLSLDHVTFPVGSVLENLQRETLPAAQAKHLLLTFLVPNAVAALRVKGDPSRLKQVLLNLIGNALKFTSAGMVEVNINRLHDDNGKVALRFAVSDTGIGIAPADQRRIFNAFEQADSSITRHHNGAGLGLAICRSLIRLMGGDISVQSEKGKGSTFTFSAYFDPADDEPAERSGITSGDVPIPAKESSSGRVAETVLDVPAALNNLDGDLALLQIVASALPEQIASDLAAIRVATAAGVGHEVRQSAHHLRGSLVVVGARPAAAACHALEMAATRSLVDYLALLSALEIALDALGPALADFLASAGAPTVP